MSLNDPIDKPDSTGEIDIYEQVERILSPGHYRIIGTIPNDSENNGSYTISNFFVTRTISDQDEIFLEQNLEEISIETLLRRQCRRIYPGDETAKITAEYIKEKRIHKTQPVLDIVKRTGIPGNLSAEVFPRLSQPTFHHLGDDRISYLVVKKALSQDNPSDYIWQSYFGNRDLNFVISFPSLRVAVTRILESSDDNFLQTNGDSLQNLLTEISVMDSLTSYESHGRLPYKSVVELSTPQEKSEPFQIIERVRILLNAQKDYTDMVNEIVSMGIRDLQLNSITDAFNGFSHNILSRIKSFVIIETSPFFEGKTISPFWNVGQILTNLQDIPNPRAKEKVMTVKDVIDPLIKYLRIELPRTVNSVIMNASFETKDNVEKIKDRTRQLAQYKDAYFRIIKSFKFNSMNIDPKHSYLEA